MMHGVVTAVEDGMEVDMEEVRCWEEIFLVKSSADSGLGGPG